MPQAQQVRQQGQSQGQSQKQITFQQSYECVKTMVESSLGCITYLRGLLPDDNFEDDGVNPLNKGSTSASQKKSNGNLRIKKIKGGHSTEGDMILKYLERGVFDAVERKFLKSMILAIYLDSNDPSNVVETYTFNFSYHHVPGVGLVPMMSADQGMQSMTVGSKPTDPIEVATTSGSAITLGDVKKSVKGLIKTLILHTQLLPDLPRKRCLTMKLFYNPDTPEDYEPPMFRPADPETEKMFFGTHATTEVPEITPIAPLETGHHGVSINIRSIVDHLPKAHTDQDETPYVGEGSSTAGLETEEGRKADDEAQEADQINRDIMWNAEDQVDQGRAENADAEGDSDSEVSPKSVVPQPLYNAAFAQRVGPGQFKPFPPDDVARRAERQRKIDDEKEDVEFAEPSSQAVMQILARPKKGEGDRGHKVNDSGNKLYDLATVEPDSQGFSLTQQLNGPSSMHPPSQLSQSFAEMDADEPSFLDGAARSASDDDGRDAPGSSRSVKAKGKAKFQPLMPAHQEEESTTDAQTAKSKQPIVRRTSARLHPADDDEDPIASFSNDENDGTMAVDRGRTKKKAVPSTAPPSAGHTKKTARRVVDSDDDDPIVDDSQTQSMSQPKKSASKAAPKKKKSTASKNASTAGGGGGASTSGPKKSHKKGAGKAAAATGTTGKGKRKRALAGRGPGEKAADGADSEETLECWCGDKDPDGPEAQCDGCDKWMHFYCHGGQDIAEIEDCEYFCAKCELKKDPRTHDWSDAKVNEAIQEFRTLALFRRALRVTYDGEPIANASKLAKRLACGNGDALSMLNRLVDEGFIRKVTARANSTGNVFISQSHKKRAGYEAVKNETTRKAEKAYFDRSTRAKEDQIWKLDGQAEAEQALSMDLDEEDYAHAQPPPSYSSSYPGSQPLPRSDSISVSQPLRTDASIPTGQLVDLSTNSSPPNANADAAMADEDSQTQSQWGHTQMQPSRVPLASTSRQSSGSGAGAMSPPSSTSSSGKKRKAYEVDAEGEGEVMALGPAMAVAGTGQVGQNKRVRASVASEGIDISY